MKPLTPRQFTKAFEYYQKHKEHVENLIKGVGTPYPPTSEEDRETPGLFKAAHWAWFVECLKLRSCIYNTVSDLFKDFFYYDRKEDEALPRGAIEKAVKDGIISVDELLELIEIEVANGLKE
jgi:hypothetical protein